MKIRTNLLSIILLLIISATINAESYELQLRSRSGDNINYKTVEWDADETAFLFVRAPEAMGKRSKLLLDKAKSNGSIVTNAFTKIAPDKKAKHKIFLGTIDGNLNEKTELAGAVLVRDLINIPGAKNYRERELAVIELEKQGFATISSVDLLGGQALRSLDDKRPHVVVMISDDHYKADTWMPPLIEKFQNDADIYFTILHGEGGAVFRGIDELETADSLVVYFRRLALHKDQLEKVKKFVESGRGVVGLRTASHGFSDNKKKKPDYQNWDGFDKKILGGSYNGHGKDELGSEISNIPDKENSPILDGVKPANWHSTGSVYYMKITDENAVVYQYASSSERKNVPLTWTRMYGKTRVAFTALGHWDDVKEPPFQKVFLNLIKWSIDKK
ncbi:MAG: ThuA domain-containing protein [Planctomycetaceae bacterium]|jgi:type 1 glutamine amidotransferase|nr:ThuA domain-containing protein [Planctomycetaceae bacterium]